MTNIALEFTYHTDVIEVPEFLARDIKKVQRRFDQWLYDKDNDHGCWVIVNGKKRGVAFDSSVFVNYLNTHVLLNNESKARIVYSNLKKVPSGMPTLFF